MGRVIGGVVLGYIAMFAVVFIGLTVIYLLMGADKAFQEGSFTPCRDTDVSIPLLH